MDEPNIPAAHIIDAARDFYASGDLSRADALAAIRSAMRDLTEIGAADLLDDARSASERYASLTPVMPVQLGGTDRCDGRQKGDRERTTP